MSNVAATETFGCVKSFRGWEILVDAADDEPRVRDIDIAERAGMTQPRDVRRIIQKHRSTLESHGPITERTGRVRSGTLEGFGPQEREVTEYWLTEHQAHHLAFWLRTPKAVALQVEIVRLFVAWRRGELVQRETPTARTPTRAELARMVLVEAERADLAEARARRPVAERGPIRAVDGMTLDEVSKELGTGPRRLARWMVEQGILKPGGRLPYQEQVDQGRFRMVGGRILVTDAGLAFLRSMLAAPVVAGHHAPRASTRGAPAIQAVVDAASELRDALKSGGTHDALLLEYRLALCDLHHALVGDASVRMDLQMTAKRDRELPDPANCRNRQFAG